MNKIIAIVGPTAIGKTALAIELALHFDTEIISTDSRQFYQEMSIGTAKPTKEELQQVTHHFINNLSIKENYSVGQFEREAILKLENIFKKKNIVIAVGGSGLYDRALLYGLDEFPNINPTIRENLIQEYKENGIEQLQNLLKLHDETYFQQVDLNNHQRIIRALEVSIGTGKPFSSYRINHTTNRNFQFIQIGITAPREIIYQRINQRVEKMIEQGLVEEAQNLYTYKHLNALNTVGYKEVFQYMEGIYDANFMKEEIQKNTRRFAKRQLTWYKKQPNIIWTENPTVNKIAENIRVNRQK